MKKVILFSLLLLSSLTMKAQPKGFYYYSRVGLGVSDFKNASNSNQTEKLALNFGAGGNYQFNKYIGIIVEANLTSKGSKISGIEDATFTSPDKPYQDIYKLFYAEIPFMLKLSYPLTENFYINCFGGISNNFNLLGLYSRNYNDPNERDNLDKEVNGIRLSEQSYVLGLGFEAKDNFDHLYSIDFRTNTAFTSFGNVQNSQNNVISGFNNYYTIGFGYSF